MPPMAQQEIAARLASYAQTTPHDVERVVIQNGLAHGDFSGIARALPEVYRAAAGRWMQQPQAQAQPQAQPPQVQPQPQTQPPQPTAMPAQQDMQVPNVQANDVAVPPSQEMTAQMPQEMQGQAQAVPTTEDLTDIRQKLAALDAMMQGNPTYVEARRRGDWQTAAQEAAKAGHHDFARFYQMLHEKATGAPINITPYQNPAEKAAAEQGAVRPTPAPEPIHHVDPMRPVDIPKSYGARRDFGRGLIEAMRTRNLTDVRALNDDLRDGEKRAIEHALKRIAQADAEDALLRGETAAQRANDNETVQAESRKKQDDDVQVESAQKQGKEKTANEGGLDLADGYTTESGRPLSEADEKEFIIKPNGSRNFGEITKTISDAVMQQSGEKLEIGEIRLRVGNHSEGLIHAKAHEKQAQDAGYDSIENLIADVAENYDQIYMRAPVEAGQNPTYSLVKLGNKSKGVMNRVAPIYFELQADGGGNYYIVVSAMPKGDKTLAKQTKKDRLIYSSPGLDAATESNAGAVSASARNVGADSRGGSPTSDKSSGLVTSTIPSDVSESKQKRASNANGEGNSSTAATATAPMRTRRDGEDALSSVSNRPSEHEKSKEKSVQAKSAPLTKQEQEALTGTSEEAKEAYRIVRDKLAKSKNKSVVRAAKVGATLFARHADIYAKAYSKATGKPYTALDYLQDKFGLDADGKEVDGRAGSFDQSAWHGTPHKFKKFDLGAIGTGEGAQVHGWGLYFAQQKSVGEGYREGLTGGKWRVSHGDEVYEFDYDTGDLIHEGTGSVMSHDDPETLAIEAFIGSNANKYGALNILENALEDKRRMFFPGEALDEEVGRIEDAIELLENEWSRFDVEPSGSLFQVEIPDNDVLLDEQLSFDKQPEKVQEALKRIADEMRSTEEGSPEAEFAENYRKMNGKKTYEALTHITSDYEDASRLLNNHGIKGITYDGQRDGRCFVIFDDEAIEIIEKFNQRMNSIRKGSITPQASGRRIISLFEQADESTFLHEMGHMFLMDLEDIASLDEANAEDLETVRDWATWQEGQAKEYEDTPWQKEFAEREKAILAAKKRGDVVEVKKLKREWEQERFARGFERYLETGKAPTSVLKRIFLKFKKFLERIYQAFKGTGGKASPEVEAVMGRMIAEKEQSANSEFEENPVQAESAPIQADFPASKLKGAVGKDANIVTDSGEEIPVRYRLVEALSLVTSNSATDFSKNPAYPKSLQPRDRERANMQQQIHEIVSRLRPEDLAASRSVNLGAPVVRADGVVLNGNGRAIAITRALLGNTFGDSTGKGYRTFLVKNAEEFGFKPETVQRMKAPMLVREVTGGLSAEQVKAVTTSTAGGSRLGASEQAKQDAEKITLEDLARYEENERGDLTTAANRDFVAGILYRVAGKNDVNAYTDAKGQVNADGIQRVKRALFQKAYGDDDLLSRMSESTNDDTRNITNGLTIAAPYIARANEKMASGTAHSYNLGETIADAVKRYNHLHGIGQSVENYLDQQAMFAEYEDSPEVREVLRVLNENRRSGKRIAQFVRRVGEIVEAQGNPNEISLMEGGEPLSLGDVIHEAQKGLNAAEAAPILDTLFQEAPALKKAAIEYGATEKDGEVTFENPEREKEFVRIAEALQDDVAKKLSANRQETLSKVLKEVDFIAPEKLTKIQQGIADFGKEMGMPVVFFKGAKNLHGFHASNGVTFLNTESETSLRWTFWHEALHWMKANNEELFREIIADVEKAGAFTKAQLDGYRKAIGAPKLSDADVIEEMLADALPDVKKRVPLLKDLGKRNKSLAERLVGWIREVMDSFRDFFAKPQMGLTKAQSAAMRDAFAALARDMVDERGRRIFRVDGFNRRIALANGSPLPAAKYSLDNGGRQAEEASILMQLYNKGHYSELVRMDEENRHLPHGSTRKQANVVQADLLKKYRNLDITNKSTGEIARITKDGAGKMVSDKAIAKSIANGFSGDEHLQAVSEIKALFENGELIRVAPDKKGSADIQAIKHFWIRRQDGSYANILVKQYTDARIPQKIYTLELQELKKPSDLKDVSDEHPSEGVEPDATALGFGAPRGNGSISNFSITQKGEEGNRNLYEKPRLAPNGKPSNLTKEQYEAVRTPAFKAWFGDWEHDAANASKVVDENGEPLVVYHATLSDFTKFRPSEDGMYGKGIYLTADKEDTSYTLQDEEWRILELFANIRNPRDPEAVATQEDIDAAKKEALEFFKKHPFDKDGTPASFVVNNLLFWDMQPGKVKKSRLTQILKDAFARKGVTYRESGKHDGAIIRRDGATWYTAFKPNQVKSATNNIGAYNTNEDDIRFSVKFSRDNSKPGSMGRFRKLLVGLKIGETAESNLEVHRSNKEKQLIIAASKLDQFMADKSLTEKNVLKTEDLGGGKIRVTYMPQDFHNIHILDWVKSVRQLRKKNPFVKAIYDLGSRAMRLQEHLRNEGAKTVKEFRELTKSENDRKLVTHILLEGDAAGKEYGVQELRAMGANANVIKAYQLVRRTMREWYKRVNDARMQVETRTKTLSKNDLADFKKNHWIADSDVLSVEEKGDGKVLLTWRGGKTYETKDKVMTKTELDALLQDKDINVAHVHKLNDSYGVDNYSVDYVERIKPLGNLTGYMPHFFHEWMVYEKHKDPKTGEVRLTAIGSGRSMNDAVRLGNEIARKNSDKEYVVQPKGFDLDVENSVVIGDADFQQMAAKLADETQMTLADANAFLRDSAGATIRARHRFFGNAMHRTGAKGFDTDITYVLTHYLNTSARYIAMEQFKPRAVTLYERWFGAFDAEPKDDTAKYVKGLIKDINGDPRPLEKSVSELIMMTPIGKMISDAYGDRAALAVNGELSTLNAISKLGLGNFASMAVNYSQFINIGAAMNDYSYAAKGFWSALKPTAADMKILEESGVLDEINQAADNGGYTQRRFGRVGSVYGAIKRGGELSLLPFQYADVLMRKTAILGAYKQGVEKLGLSHEEAMERARDINYDANFDYSAANAPLMIRAGSVVTQQMFQFQKYPIMQMEFMYNILKNGTRGQKVRFLLPYVLMCGIPGIVPFGEIFNQIFSFLFRLATGDDKDIGDEIKAEALRWAGKDPVKKAIVNASIYGVLAPVFGIDVSKRIGISGAFSGEFFGAQKPESVLDVLGMQLGGPMASTAVNMANQIHNGNPIEALKAFSPALGNMAQAMVGVSRTTRHRVKSRYETTYDRIIHAMGFRSVDESNNSFITSYEFDRKDAETHAKQEAIMDYIDDPSEANRQRINALGIKDKAIEEARIQQERSATERAKGGRPKVESGKTSKRRTSHKRKEEKPKKETLFDTIEDDDEGM